MDLGMCGRYTQTQPPDGVVQRFLLDMADMPADVHPRYNVAPSQKVLTVVAGPDRRRPAVARWGFLPVWARESKIAQINARSETAATSPMFRSAMRARHCLVIADSFYEWARRGSGKTPMRFMLRDGGLFAFAGIWEEWPGGPDGPVRTCAILTTRPNDLVSAAHDRMPVILRPEMEAAWLHPEQRDADALAAIFEPYPPSMMQAYPVSSRVNTPRSDGPDLILPAS